MNEQDIFAVPSRAVETFEELTGLNVVVHDLVGVIGPFLAPHRFRHSMPPFNAGDGPTCSCPFGAPAWLNSMIWKELPGTGKA